MVSIGINCGHWVVPVTIPGIQWMRSHKLGDQFSQKTQPHTIRSSRSDSHRVYATQATAFRLSMARELSVSISGHTEHQKWRTGPHSGSGPSDVMYRTHQQNCTLWLWTLDWPDLWKIAREKFCPLLLCMQGILVLVVCQPIAWICEVLL